MQELKNIIKQIKENDYENFNKNFTFKENNYDYITFDNEKTKKDLFTVFDLEFYGVKPQHAYGNLKQVAFITFDSNYKIIDVYDETFIDVGNQYQNILKDVDAIMSAAKINFAWGCHQDLKTMHEFGFDLSKYKIVDMQTPFLFHSKQNTLGGTYYKLTGKQIVGAHNALIDAKYTFEIIKMFDLARSGGVEQLEIYARYLLRGSRASKELNGLTVEDRQMLKQLTVLIQSKCKAPAYAQLDKVVVMLNERVEEGILDVEFVREKRRYYKSRIKDIKEIKEET